MAKRETEIAKNLKRLLKLKNWSGYRLAQAMRDSGFPIGTQNVYDWINSRSEPMDYNKQAICKVLDCTSKELLGW